MRPIRTTLRSTITVALRLHSVDDFLDGPAEKLPLAKQQRMFR